MTFLLDVQNSPLLDGSALVEQGLTKVSATVCGPRDSRLSSKSGQLQSDRANLNVEVLFAAFSGNERRRRAKGDR